MGIYNKLGKKLQKILDCEAFYKWTPQAAIQPDPYLSLSSTWKLHYREWPSEIPVTYAFYNGLSSISQLLLSTEMNNFSLIRRYGLGYKTKNKEFVAHHTFRQRKEQGFSYKNLNLIKSENSMFYI